MVRLLLYDFDAQGFLYISNLFAYIRSTDLVLVRACSHSCCIFASFLNQLIRNAGKTKYHIPWAKRVNLVHETHISM